MSASGHLADAFLMKRSLYDLTASPISLSTEGRARLAGSSEAACKMVLSKDVLLASSSSSSSSSSVHCSWHKSSFKGAKRAVLVKAAAARAPALRDHSINFTPEAKRKLSTGLLIPAKQRVEVIESMADWAQTNLLSLLKPVEKCWQPQDYLPVSSSPTFADEVFELQKRMSNIPDDQIVCLVGDMITEEALPTYQTMFNTFEGVRDVSGCSNTPWAIWIRAWTAEENRHGELLNKYLYLSGRVNMMMVERTIQSLIGSGMEPHIDNDPYNGFIYTAFQERATFISHGNTARHAKEYGDSKLAVICGMIAADEKRHELAYTKVMSRIFEIDPSGAMLALEHMMRKKITMPAHLMYDGTNSNLFNDYAAIAQHCNVYTSKDYTDIMEHLIKVWDVEKLVGLSYEAQRAQEYVCNLVQRFRKLEERSARQAKPRTRRDISWISKPVQNL